MTSADVRVAATMALAGVMPAATMSASSACAEYPYGAPTPASVPNAIRTPAAESFARLRACTSNSRGRGGDATAVFFNSSIARRAEASR